MADWRATQKAVCTDPRHAMLSEYGQILAMRLPLHADDYGAVQVDPLRIKLMCTPASQRSLEDVEAALIEMALLQLIGLYKADDGALWAEFGGWEADQPREMVRKRRQRRSPEPTEFIDVSELPGLFRKVPESSGLFRKIPPRVEESRVEETRQDKNPPSEGSARGFALAPPPVEPAAPKRKAKKEPTPPPEPVPVPAHMQPLVEYQLRALARTDGPATQTVDCVVRWAIDREKLLGWPVDWKWRIAAFEDWQESPKGRRYTNTTGALGTWMERARKDGKLEAEWRAGAQPSGAPPNGQRKGFGAPGAPTNPDGSFNPNHGYNPWAENKNMAPRAYAGMSIEEVAALDAEIPF